MLKTLKQARTAFSLLFPDDIRARASRPVTFGLVASGESAFAEMEDFLIPADAPAAVRAQLAGLVWRAADPGVPENVDLVLYEHGVEGPEGTYTFHRGDPRRTVTEIVRENDDIAPALAQRYPAFRAPVVERVVQTIARENALFAVATALPDLIPNFGELPWAFGEFASDTAFLTANQVRMAFLIAAACGRPVGFAHQRTEIVAIGAGAFGWRAIARELAGKIPFGGGLIPKGAIAYAVTYGIGKGLERLYHAGERYTRAQRREVYQQAYERGRAVAESAAGSALGRAHGAKSAG
jgi:uncharacterized protein (DUF697 family)